MKILIPVFLAIGVVGLWLLGNATWILVLANLIFLLIKGSLLVSWAVCMWTGGGFIALFVLYFALILWSKA